MSLTEAFPEIVGRTGTVVVEGEPLGELPADHRHRRDRHTCRGHGERELRPSHHTARSRARERGRGTVHGIETAPRGRTTAVSSHSRSSTLRMPRCRLGSWRARRYGRHCALPHPRRSSWRRTPRHTRRVVAVSSRSSMRQNTKIDEHYEVSLCQNKTASSPVRVVWTTHSHTRQSP